MTEEKLEQPSMNARAIVDHGPHPNCPMCGSEAYLVWPRHKDSGRVKCLNTECGLEGGEGRTIREAVGKWSRRFSTPPGDDEVERLIQRASGYISLATRLGNRTDSDHNHIVIMEELVAAITAIPSRGEARAAELEGALRRLCDDAENQLCQHENTHRGGLIWTICDECDRKWADDEGGFVPYSTPDYISRARAVLAPSEESAA